MEDEKKYTQKEVDLIRMEKIERTIAEIILPVYSIKSVHLYREKCEKCDEFRQIGYISPLGRKTAEYCDVCSDGREIYIPRIYNIIHFPSSHKQCQDFIISEPENKPFGHFILTKGTFYFLENEKDIDNFIAKILECENYERPFFKNKELCIEFCNKFNKANNPDVKIEMYKYRDMRSEKED